MFTNLPVTQFYKVSVDNDYPFYNIMGGTQDNYSMVGPSQTLSSHGIVTADWIVTSTGDGFESVVDPVDPNIIYTQSQYGNLARFDKKSGESRMIQPKERKGEKTYNWNWDQVNSFDGVPATTYVYDLIADKHDVNVVYAAFNNHKAGDLTPYVYKSSDKGKTWVSISSDLPEGAVYALEQDHVNPDILFAGTEYGVYVTLDGGEMWRRIKSGLPTINVRDMAIQERENDLVLATFGRGFYVLDNYATLRDINPDLKEKDGDILTIKDALMFNRWRPLGGLGSRTKGFQGEDYFSAPNPEYGVIIKYWIKEGVTSLKAEFMKNLLLVRLFVRELRKSLGKGLNKITWDMQYPSTYSVSAGNASETSGIEVVPGTYKVSMSKNVKGEVAELAGPVSFKIKALKNLSLPAKDRSELVAFKRKAIELNGAVSAVSQAIGDMNKKIAPYKAATKVFHGQEAADLMNELRSLANKVKNLQLMLSGDRTPGQLDLDGDVALRRRAGTAMYGLFGNFSDIPGSAKKQYEIAAEEFAPLYSKTKALMLEFEKMDKKMGDIGAPITPGKLPDWR